VCGCLVEVEEDAVAEGERDGVLLGVPAAAHDLLLEVDGALALQRRQLLGGPRVLPHLAHHFPPLHVELAKHCCITISIDIYDVATTVVGAGEHVIIAGRHVHEELVIDGVLLVEVDQVLLQVVVDLVGGILLLGGRPDVPELEAQVVPAGDGVRLQLQELAEGDGVHQLGEGVLLLALAHLELERRPLLER
jgi:hypothetical protein